MSTHPTTHPLAAEARAQLAQLRLLGSFGPEKEAELAVVNDEFDATLATIAADTGMDVRSTFEAVTNWNGRP